MNYTDPQTIQTLADKRKRIAELESEYVRTQELLKSPEWGAKRDKVLERVAAIAGLYVIKNHKASFAMGQIKEALLAIQEPLDVIVEYEGLKKYFKEIQQMDEELK